MIVLSFGFLNKQFKFIKKKKQFNDNFENNETKMTLCSSLFLLNSYE